jgi:hypothetical protein
LGVAAEVGGGYLQAVEEDGASFVVDVSAGEAAEDVVEGNLDGGAVVDAGEGEGAGASGAGAFAAGAGVVVAEVLAAEGGRAAAVSVGEDVAAEVAAGGVDGGWRGRFGVHGVPLYLSPKVCGLKVLGLDLVWLVQSVEVKYEGPAALAGPCFVYWINCSGLTQTTMPLILIYYLV